MAFQLGASSSSSPSSSPPTRSCNHDVFLSFRGEDVGGNFISHLYKALVERGINTYIDNNLERGEEISPAIFQVIEGSKISIIVFSKNYAESRRCLDEVLKILDCKETKKQIVLPIFFQVEPWEVRHQKGIFEKSFDKLGDELKDNAKMVKWKEALEKVAGLAGFPFPSAKFRDESECIEKIVQEVSRKIPNRTMLECIEKIVQEVSSKLPNRTMLACRKLSGWIGVPWRRIVQEGLESRGVSWRRLFFFFFGRFSPCIGAFLGALAPVCVRN